MSNQEKLYTILNQTVADLSQTSALIHQVHWYMRGKGFLYLHPAMDTLRADIEALTDEF
ncbi:DNA starvation/stationary phase protection protein, partial [Anaerotruncus sp. X29]|nr:DNA starvation/stationary phase protection protein [Anaerotruncus sp. X29]